MDRHSVRAQGDADGFVAVDTLILDKKLRGDAFQLTFRLFSENAGAVPTVRSASLAMSRDYNKMGEFVPGNPALWNTAAGGARVLADGLSRRWHGVVQPDVDLDGAGVLVAGDTGPCEPRVRAAVEGVYDWVYDGHGNWPFNTAYAATQGLEAEVVRFESMADAERWVAAGVPVVISYYWDIGDLDRRPDPLQRRPPGRAGRLRRRRQPDRERPRGGADADVQRTYLRSELEHLWVKKSGGTAYLIYPTGHPVPAMP